MGGYLDGTRPTNYLDEVRTSVIMDTTLEFYENDLIPYKGVKGLHVIIAGKEGLDPESITLFREHEGDGYKDWTMNVIDRFGSRPGNDPKRLTDIYKYLITENGKDFDGVIVLDELGYIHSIGGLVRGDMSRIGNVPLLKKLEKGKGEHVGTRFRSGVKFHEYDNKGSIEMIGSEGKSYLATLNENDIDHDYTRQYSGIDGDSCDDCDDPDGKRSLWEHRHGTKNVINFYPGRRQEAA